MPDIAFLGADVAGKLAEMDADLNVVKQFTAQTEMRPLTPLAAMELYEQLHAARNEVRRRYELPEVPLSDFALVLLAFLRQVDRLPGPWALGELPEQFAQTVREIQERRLEHAER